MDLLMCKSSLLCVHPFSKVQSSCLSTNELLYLIVLLWMLKSQTFLLLTSEHLYANFPPFLTISPQLIHCCKRLSNLILMHLFVWLNLIAFTLVIFHFFNFKFSTHQRSSCFDRLLNAISTWHEQTWFSDCICCCKYLKCKLAGRTALAVENITPISVVNFKAVVWEWERRLWHLKIIFSIFSSVTAKVMVWVSIFRPKPSICWDSFRTLFFQIYDITKIRKQKNQCVSAH